MVKKMDEKEILIINDYCKERIKPKLIRDVKTEALLVFSRTALENFFNKLDEQNAQISLSNTEDSEYVYNTLRELLNDLQAHIVNANYLIELIQNAKRFPSNLELSQVVKYEEPLINYYDTMAKRMEYHFPSKTVAIPELIVICVLCNWFIEDERSTTLFPFIKKYDLCKLIDKFEIYAINSTDDKKKLISRMQYVAIDIADVLKKVKYKFNTKRVSKQRRNKSKRK